MWTFHHFIPRASPSIISPALVGPAPTASTRRHQQPNTSPSPAHALLGVAAGRHGRLPSAGAGRSLHLFCAAAVPYMAASATDRRLCASLHRPAASVPLLAPQQVPARSLPVGHGGVPGGACRTAILHCQGCVCGGAWECMESCDILLVIMPNCRGNMVTLGWVSDRAAGRYFFFCSGAPFNSSREQDS